jgi:23S rRNA (cytosine1962-C5)-methyltransferase
MTYSKIFLQSGKEIAVKRLHPWIFSGAIARKEGNPQDGDIVEVFDKKGTYLCTGHYFDGSIAVKIFSYQQAEINENFWLQKLEIALEIRQKTLDFQSINCFRLVHGEGDGFAGLIMDYYDGVVVFQAHSIGMWRVKEQIVEALKKLNFPTKLKAIYDKSQETLPDKFAQKIQNSYLFTDNSITLPHPSIEHSNKFMIDWETGQKTGFFLDQRDNRQLLGQYAKGKKVLNAFCYSGGFSIYAIKEGAELVHSVDVSKKAIELVNQNVEANFGKTNNHEAFAEDVMAYLKRNDQFYDLIILDPPAYAKSIAKRHNAVQGYKRLNIEGLKRLAKGGILFTFSCSQVVDRQLFQDTIVAAAMEVGRNVRILHHLSQGADHPVNLFHPEGSYLKGLVLYVE